MAAAAAASSGARVPAQRRRERRRYTCVGLLLVASATCCLYSAGLASVPAPQEALPAGSAVNISSPAEVQVVEIAPEVVSIDAAKEVSSSTGWSLLSLAMWKLCFLGAAVGVAVAAKQQTKNWKLIFAALSAATVVARFFLLSSSMDSQSHGDAAHSQSTIVTLLSWVYEFAVGMLFIIMLALLRRFLKKVGVVQHVQLFGGSSLLPGTGSIDSAEAPSAGAREYPSAYLLFCFAVWYYGNYQHNICNKLALNRTGGADGFPFTIATCQLAVGVAYAAFLWIAPDARKKPKITFKDWSATLPVSLFAAGAHAGSVFALSAGALSFGQIVKACEPAFAAAVGTVFYGSTVSRARWMCLIPIIGGVCLSSLAELDFTWSCLVAASAANLCAAIRGCENKKLLASDGTNDRMRTVGNQYAITTINAFIFMLPLTLYTEGHKLHEFIALCRADSALYYNVLLSGWWFYIYNEVATKIIKKTNPVTQSIANTAKRAIIIVIGAMVLGESLNVLKLVGCTIAIGGVLLYSEIDKLVQKHKV